MYPKPVVLIMGNQGSHISALKEACGREDYNIICSSEINCLDNALKDPFSAMIVIFDLSLCDEHCYEMFESTTFKCKKNNLPVIAITNNTIQSENIAIALGADEVITVPFNITVAGNRIKNMVSQAQMNLHIVNQQTYIDAIMSETLFTYDFDVEFKTINLLYRDSHSEQNYYNPMNYVMFCDHPELIHPHDRAKVMDGFAAESLTKAFERGENQIMVQCRILNLLGKWIWVEVTAYLMRNTSTNTVRGVAYVKVINDLKKLEKKAQMDAVSNLYNRATAEEKIALSLQQDYHSSAFFLYDIDNFKMVNDTFGHAEGDRLLHRISVIFKSAFSVTDIIGRIGGDEFVVLFKEADSLYTIERKAQDTIDQVSRISEEYGWSFKITASLGVALASPDLCSFEELYRAADKALYAAKFNGKNGFVVYEGKPVDSL